MKTDKIWPKKKVLKKVRFFLFLFALAAIHNRTVYVYHRSRIFVKTRRKYSMSGKISNTSQCLLFMYLALLVFCFIFCSSCTYITYVFPSKNILFCTPPPPAQWSHWFQREPDYVKLSSSMILLPFLRFVPELLLGLWRSPGLCQIINNQS